MLLSQFFVRIVSYGVEKRTKMMYESIGPMQELINLQIAKIIKIVFIEGNFNKTKTSQIFHLLFKLCCYRKQTKGFFLKILLFEFKVNLKLAAVC